MPGGTTRNLDSYGSKVSTLTDEQRAILADPQTSGGLLISVDANRSTEFEKVAADNGLKLSAFGKLISKVEKVIRVL
jgi:selenide,water dikinase